MKRKYLSIQLLVLSALIFIFFLPGCSPVKPLVKLSADDVQQLISSESFVFIANRMVPLRGGQRHLQTGYDVKVKDSVLVSSLPYFGRAYAGSMVPSGYGLSFTSNDFTYSSQQDKKNSYIVTITPKDVQDVQSLRFTIFDNGSTTLDVTSINKDPISFSGILQPNQ